MAENDGKKGGGLRLTVSTPARTVMDTDADYVLLRSVGGEIGILRGHEPCALRLDNGLLRVFSDKQPTGVLAVMGGFAMVRDNAVTVVTGFAELPDRVEQALAEREREREENRKREQISDMEMQRAESALRRALVHLDVSTYSIIKGHDEQSD